MSLNNESYNDVTSNASKASVYNVFGRIIRSSRAFAVSLVHLTTIVLRHYEKLRMRIRPLAGYMFCRTVTNLYLGRLRTKVVLANTCASSSFCLFLQK